MNGYKITADSYRELLKSEQDINRASVESKIKALDFLAACTEAERLELFNSSAFNNVVKGYLEMACNNIGLDEETRKRLLNEFSYLFDTVTADQAEAYYNSH